jgi:transcriptional regulator GlxA family with amidase domain
MLVHNPAEGVDAMQIAIFVYDRFTALDAIGPYEVLSRLPGARVVFTARDAGPVTTDTGTLSLLVDTPIAEVPHPDIVVVPGGPGQATGPQLEDGPVHEWLRAVDQHTTITASVCTGSLILAAAGLLAGRRATTHWLALDRLADYGVQPVSERVVIDGTYITAAGVSAGIDMALALTGRIGGQEIAESIQLMLEYDPQPPYQSGSPRTAPADLVARMRLGSRHAAASRTAG